MILAIDPGNKESALAGLDENLKPIIFTKVNNNDLLFILGGIQPDDQFVIEMVASYGMAVGETVFETVFWIGRFYQEAKKRTNNLARVYRKDVKMNLCHTMKAKDSNIRQALIDRFAKHDLKNGKGTKKEPDWFHGFHSDIWAAYAVAVTFYDLYLSKGCEKAL